MFRARKQSSMFTWMLLGTDWTEFDVTALFERCKDGEWFYICPHAKAHQLLTSNSHTHTHTQRETRAIHHIDSLTQHQHKWRRTRLNRLFHMEKNQRQTEHWLCIGGFYFSCNEKSLSPPNRRRRPLIPFRCNWNRCPIHLCNIQCVH